MATRSIPPMPAGFKTGTPKFIAKVIKEQGLSSELVRKHVALYKQGKTIKPRLPFSAETIRKIMKG